MTLKEHHSVKMCADCGFIMSIDINKCPQCNNIIFDIVPNEISVRYLYKPGKFIYITCKLLKCFFGILAMAIVLLSQALGINVYWFIPAIILYGIFRRKENFQKQKIRDYVAQHAIESINNMEPIEEKNGSNHTQTTALPASNKPLCLYLRPFTIDGKILVDNPGRRSPLYWLWYPNQANSSLFVDLEELILITVEKWAEFDAIGYSSDEALGAGKICSSDENWRSYFIALANKAVCIFSVPSLNNSTIWELEWLANNKLYSKVVMLFTKLHLDAKDENYNYLAIKQRLFACGWQLPDMVEHGSIITFDSSGRFSAHLTKTNFKMEYLSQAVNQIRNV